MLARKSSILVACLISVEMSDISQFLIYSHVRMWRHVLSTRNWRMSRNLTSFVCFSSNEMSWQLIYISLSTCCTTWESIYLNFDEMFCLLATDACLAISDFVAFLDSCSHVQILTRCLATTLYLAVYDRFLHVRIVLDVRWIISLLIRSHMLWDTFIKVFDQKFVSHERRFFYKIWFDLQYFRINFKMRFISNVRSENCSARTTFSL